MTLVWDSLPRSFDPRYSVDANSQYLDNLLHRSLITFNKDGVVEGDLASSWKWSDHKTLHFVLKKDAKFADGTLVTPQDVKTTYDFFLNNTLKTPSPRIGAFSALKSIQIGKEDIVFILSEPDSSFLTNLVIGILPTAKILALNGGMIKSDMMFKGSGPFSLVRVGVGELELEENPHFVFSHKEHVQKIVIKIVKEKVTAFAKLQKGEVDLIQNGISLDDLHKVMQNKYPDLQVEVSPALKTTYIGFNFQDNILKNPNVRRAISYGIDREKIIKFVLQGFAVQASTLLPKTHPYYHQGLISMSYDMKLAEKLLDDAGFKRKGPKNMRLELTYTTTNDLLRVNIAHAIASELSKIGVDIKVQSVEWGRFKDDVEHGRIQMWGLSWIGFKDPDIYRYAFSTQSFPPGGANRGRFSNKDLDKLLDEAKQTIDEVKRKALYVKVQELIQSEVPYVFLWHDENVVVNRKNIKNYTLYADGMYSSLKDVIKI